MLQWSISFPEFAEFVEFTEILFYLGKTPLASAKEVSRNKFFSVRFGSIGRICFSSSSVWVINPEKIAVMQEYAHLSSGFHQ